MDKPSDEIRAWMREWVKDIYAAENGDIGPLIAAIRSSRQIGLEPQTERYIRSTIADLLSGKKRRRGRQKLSTADAIRKKFDQAELVREIDRIYRKMLRKRVGNARQAACDEYALRRGNITGASILRAYRAATKTAGVMEIVRLINYRAEVPLASLFGKR